MASEIGAPRTSSMRAQILLLGVVLTLANLAAIIHKSSRVYLFQQSQCLAYYLAVDPTKIDAQSRVEEVLCKVDDVQSRLSITDGLDSFLSCLPGKCSLCLRSPSLICKFTTCALNGVHGLDRCQ